MNSTHCRAAFVIALWTVAGAAAGQTVAGESPSPPGWRALPQVQQGATLDDCAAKLAASGGGWCEIRAAGRQPSIGSVFPSNLDRRTHRSVGPKAVLIAWSSVAIDRQRERMYFFGGGHADYGGNEVYEFDLAAGRWSRLTDPSPPAFLFRIREARGQRPARYCWVPDLRKVPGSVRSYDGLEFNPHTRTVFLVAGPAANGSCFDDASGEHAGDPRVLSRRDVPTSAGQFEFNPSREQARNGLAPLAWRRVESRRWSLPRSVVLPDGRMLAGTHTALWHVQLADGHYRVGARHSVVADLGDGSAIYDIARDRVWSLHRDALLGISMRGEIVTEIRTNPRHGKSLQLDADGRLVAWSGRNEISLVDPDADTPTWRTLEWGEHGPALGDRRVYGKWRYLPGRGLFVGIASPATGVWVYRHPPEAPLVTWSTVDAQRLIDRTPANGVVAVPPGLYGRGLFVGKSLTVKLAGVDLRGIAHKKGVVNVRCDQCKVVLEDLHVDGVTADCLDANCAGIRAEGVNFDLTVRRARIDNTVMGILTDNRGGSLLIEDSSIENTARDDRSRTLGHGVYAGIIDSLEIRNSTIRRVFGKGHILKSRARRTTIERSALLGLDGTHSRSIDLPCGGTLEVRASTIQHGERSDNADLIGVGTERRGCGGSSRAADVTIVDSTIISDRDRSDDEPARDAGPTSLFNWRSDVTRLQVSGNRIVVPEGGGWTWNRGTTPIAGQGMFNLICTTREQCGVR